MNTNFVVTQRKITLDNDGNLDMRLVISNKTATHLIQVPGSDLEGLLKVLMRGDVDSMVGAVVLLAGSEQLTLQNAIDTDTEINVQVLDSSKQEG